MRFAGDFHIHSHYSRATSRQLTPEKLDYWARKKGIAVLGTGDFTHPGWTQELKEHLVPAEEGLFVLKNEYRIPDNLSAEIKNGTASSPEANQARTRFILTAEVSSIYKYGEKVRKVHNVIFAPDFPAILRIQEKIEQLGGNIRSDGRPILGLDSRDLLELCLEADDRIFFVPAHIWTPWFSALGSKSGFDTIKECYRDLSEHISAVETGLSSDPPMNWMCSFLDSYTIISNSDAHSPEKLGREANLFDTELSYPDIIRALSKGAEAGFRGTIEFFPQEGKYHFDGHRKCSVVWTPLETLQNGGICPVCGRPVTIGVLNRVAQLADRTDVAERPNRDPFYSLIPLPELLAELEGVGPQSKKVQSRYENCLKTLGAEFDILLYREKDEIAQAEGEELAEAVDRMRRRQVRVEEGYDGEYGTIHIWNAGDPPPRSEATPSLFDSPTAADLKADTSQAPEPLAWVDFDLAAYQRKRKKAEVSDFQTIPTSGLTVDSALPGGTDSLESCDDSNDQNADDTLAAASGTDCQNADTPQSPTSEPSDRAENPASARPPESSGKDSADKTENAARKTWPSGLNPEQEAAASYSGGPSLIIAGPGTGKTHTVVEKIRTLLSTGTNPEGIVAITFANKAAEELRERLAALKVPIEGYGGPSVTADASESADRPRPSAADSAAAPPIPASKTQLPVTAGAPRPAASSAAVRPPRKQSGVKVSTFHSFGLTILQSSLPLLGRDTNFLIIDDEEKAALLAAAGIGKREERKELTEYASQVKSGIRPFPEEQSTDFGRFHRYQEILRRGNCFDFDDLVYLPVRLFEKRPAILESVGRSIRHLIIDEYQDINPIQYALIRTLSKTAELCAVGDPNQSIYGFRGSSPGFIRRFQEDFPQGRVFSLAQSYRCPDTVIRASSQVLKAENLPLFGREGGVKIDILKNPSAAFEAEQIARDIEVCTGGVGFFSFDSGVTESGSGDTAFSQIAVLCRTSLQMPLLEKALSDHRIPFRIIQTESLFAKEPYRSFLNFIRILINKKGSDRSPVGEVKDIPLSKILNCNLPSSRGKAVDLFFRLQSKQTGEVNAEFRKTPDSIIGDGFKEATDGHSEPDEETQAAHRMDHELAVYWKDDDDAAAFTVRARLGSGVDRYDSRVQAVSLMTIHASKGLEFDMVYIPGCEDGLLPYSLSGDAKTDVEEEQRLLYVAMTRAKQRVILSWAQNRKIFGRNESRMESPFLKDIQEALINLQEHNARRKSKPDNQLSLFDHLDDAAVRNQ